MKSKLLNLFLVFVLLFTALPSGIFAQGTGGPRGQEQGNLNPKGSGLDDIIEPANPSIAIPDGYKVVKFFADDESKDTTRGSFAGSGLDKVYYVNPARSQFDFENQKIIGQKADGSPQEVPFPQLRIPEETKLQWSLDKTNGNQNWLVAPQEALGLDKKITKQLGDRALTITAKYKENEKRDVSFEFSYYKKKPGVNEQIPNLATGDFNPPKPDNQLGEYIGSEVTLGSFPNPVTISTGDLQGTWAFDGWYSAGQKISGNQYTVSEIEDNNKLVGHWVLTESPTAEVSHRFIIDPNVQGPGKPVPTGHSLPQGVKAQLTNNTTNYIGSKRGPYTPLGGFKEVSENIGGEEGTWTFKAWDKTEITISKDSNKNIFIGTWTWKKKPLFLAQAKDIQVSQGDRVNPKDGIQNADQAPKNTEYKWKGDKDPSTAKAGTFDVTILVKIPNKPDQEVKTRLLVKEKVKEKPAPSQKGQNQGPARSWKGTWFLGYNSSRPTTPPVEKVKETNPLKHEKYFYGYPDGTFRPQGMITRSEAAALIVRLAKLDQSNKVKPDFKDTGDGWNNGAINAVVEKGLMLADKNGNFRPDQAITRGEFARALYYVDKKSTQKTPFKDVKGHEFEEAINQAYGNGHIAGYPDGSFKPDGQIQRAEAARILNHYSGRKLTKEDLVKTKAKMTFFKDVQEGYWAYYEIMAAANDYQAR